MRDDQLQDSLETNTPTPVTPVQPEQNLPEAPSPFFSSANTMPTESPATTPNPTEPMAPLSPATTPPKKKKLGLIVGIVAAGIIVLLGSATVLGYNFWYQNPDKVVTDALVNALTAKTVSVKGTLDIDIKADDVSAKVDFSTKGEGTTGYMDVTVDLKAEGVAYMIKGEGIVDNGDLYVKPNNLPEVIDAIEKNVGAGADFSLFDGLVTKVNGNWVKISSSDVSEFSKEYEETRKCYDDLSKAIDTDAGLGREVYDLYTKNKFIVIAETLQSKSVNGIDSMGYLIDGDKEKAKTFFAELPNTEIGKRLLACDETIDFSKIVDDATTEEGEKTRLEFWVSRFSHEFTEMNISGSDETGSGSATINPVFNQPVTIDVPTEVITVDELRAEIEKAYNDYYTDSLQSASSGSTSTSQLFN